MDFHYATQREVCRCLELDHVWGLHETRQKGLIARYQNATSRCSDTQRAATFRLLRFNWPFFFFYWNWSTSRGSKRITFKCSVPIDSFPVPVGLNGGFKCWFKATINSTSAISRSDRGADMRTTAAQWSVFLVQALFEYERT